MKQNAPPATPVKAGLVNRVVSSQSSSPSLCSGSSVTKRTPYKIPLTNRCQSATPSPHKTPTRFDVRVFDDSIICSKLSQLEKLGETSTGESRDLTPVMENSAETTKAPEPLRVGSETASATVPTVSLPAAPTDVAETQPKDSGSVESVEGEDKVEEKEGSSEAVDAVKSDDLEVVAAFTLESTVREVDQTIAEPEIDFGEVQQSWLEETQVKPGIWVLTDEGREKMGCLPLAPSKVQTLGDGRWYVCSLAQAALCYLPEYKGIIYSPKSIGKGITEQGRFTTCLRKWFRASQFRSSVATPRHLIPSQIDMQSLHGQLAKSDRSTHYIDFRGKQWMIKTNDVYNRKMHIIRLVQEKKGEGPKEEPKVKGFVVPYSLLEVTKVEGTATPEEARQLIMEKAKLKEKHLDFEDREAPVTELPDDEPVQWPWPWAPVVESPVKTSTETVKHSTPSNSLAFDEPSFGDQSLVNDDQPLSTLREQIVANGANPEVGRSDAMLDTDAQVEADRLRAKQKKDSLQFASSDIPFLTEAQRKAKLKKAADAREKKNKELKEKGLPPIPSPEPPKHPKFVVARTAAQNLALRAKKAGNKPQTPAPKTTRKRRTNKRVTVEQEDDELDLAEANVDDGVVDGAPPEKKSLGSEILALLQAQSKRLDKMEEAQKTAETRQKRNVRDCVEEQLSAFNVRSNVEKLEETRANTIAEKIRQETAERDRIEPADSALEKKLDLLLSTVESQGKKMSEFQFEIGKLQQDVRLAGTTPARSIRGVGGAPHYPSGNTPEEMRERISARMKLGGAKKKRKKWPVQTSNSTETLLKAAAAVHDKSALPSDDALFEEEGSTVGQAGEPEHNVSQPVVLATNPPVSISAVNSELSPTTFDSPPEDSSSRFEGHPRISQELQAGVFFPAEEIITLQTYRKLVGFADDSLVQLTRAKIVKQAEDSVIPSVCFTTAFGKALANLRDAIVNNNAMSEKVYLRELEEGGWSSDIKVDEESSTERSAQRPLFPKQRVVRTPLVDHSLVSNESELVGRTFTPPPEADTIPANLLDLLPVKPHRNYPTLQEKLPDGTYVRVDPDDERCKEDIEAMFADTPIEAYNDDEDHEAIKYAVSFIMPGERVTTRSLWDSAFCSSVTEYVSAIGILAEQNPTYAAKLEALKQQVLDDLNVNEHGEVRKSRRRAKGAAAKPTRSRLSVAAIKDARVTGPKGKRPGRVIPKNHPFPWQFASKQTCVLGVAHFAMVESFPGEVDPGKQSTEAFGSYKRAKLLPNTQDLSEFMARVPYAFISKKRILQLMYIIQQEPPPPPESRRAKELKNPLNVISRAYLDRLLARYPHLEGEMEIWTPLGFKSSVMEVVETFPRIVVELWLQTLSVLAGLKVSLEPQQKTDLILHCVKMLDNRLNRSNYTQSAESKRSQVIIKSHRPPKNGAGGSRDTSGRTASIKRFLQVVHKDATASKRNQEPIDLEEEQPIDPYDEADPNEEMGEPMDQDDELDPDEDPDEEEMEDEGGDFVEDEDLFDD